MAKIRKIIHLLNCFILSFVLSVDILNCNFLLSCLVHKKNFWKIFSSSVIGKQ